MDFQKGEPFIGSPGTFAIKVTIILISFHHFIIIINFRKTGSNLKSLQLVAFLIANSFYVIKNSRKSQSITLLCVVPGCHSSNIRNFEIEIYL